MAQRYVHPLQEWIDLNGDPALGWKLYFYQTGTSTPLAVYEDSGLTTPHDNPVLAEDDGGSNLAGVWPVIFMQDAVYKVVLKDENDVTIWTQDPYDARSSLDGEVTVGVEFTIDGGGVQLSTGVVRDLVVPFAGEIVGHYLLGDQTGDIVLDVWKKAYAANTVPTVANTITASAKPTLSGVINATDSTLSGWTTTVNANDHFRVKIDSVTTITRVTLVLLITRTLTVS